MPVLRISYPARRRWPAGGNKGTYQAGGHQVQHLPLYDGALGGPACGQWLSTVAERLAGVRGSGNDRGSGAETGLGSGDRDQRVRRRDPGVDHDVRGLIGGGRLVPRPLLVDHGDPGVERVGWSFQPQRTAAELDHSGVRSVNPVQQAHEGRLARPFSPRRAWTEPEITSNDTSCSARRVPNDLEHPQKIWVRGVNDRSTADPAPRPGHRRQILSAELRSVRQDIHIHFRTDRHVTIPATCVPGRALGHLVLCWGRVC